jgi:putative ABC transport system permease protein
MKDHEAVHPPRWPLHLLRLFLKKQFVEEIEGDMEEVFRDNMEQMSPAKARRAYVLEMLKLMRPVLLRDFAGVKLHSQQAMFANYFKVSFRGLMKNPLNSFINVFGLAAAIGICVFGYAFARWTYSTDQFHLLKDEVYLVTFEAERDGTAQRYGTTPRPLGDLLRNDISAIEKVCRVEDRTVVVKHADNTFHQKVRFTDPEFLEMLTFPMKWGTAHSLSDLSQIILSEGMAEKYFGDANPVGLNVQVYFDKDNSKIFKVGGVAAKFPDARTISFDFLVNFGNLRTVYPGYNEQAWDNFVNATLVQVPIPAHLPQVHAAMSKYKDLQNAAVEGEWAIQSFRLEPIATLHKQSGEIRDDISRSSDGNYATIYYMIGISVLMLLLACSNYINIAIVTAAKRLKEIGVRKSIGANRRVVITQFLAENILLTSIALVIGVILAASVFIPGFEKMWGFSMEFSFADLRLWIYLPAILLVTSLASGFYPALYISRFQVVGILKGSLQFGRRSPLTKIFLTIQLILCCVFITSAIMFTQNTSYMTKRSWGYDQSHAIYAVAPDARSFGQLFNATADMTDVLGRAGSAHHLGKSHQPTIIHLPGRDYEVDQLAVDPDYFETLGIQLKEGRLFAAHKGSDRQAVIVNEQMVTNLKWDTAIGQALRIDSMEYQVVGVVHDFHSYSFSKALQPVVFRVAEEEQMKYLTLKVSEGAQIEVYKTLQDKWAVLFPEVPFEGGLQEDVWGFYFEQIHIQSLVWRVFAFIAVMLASLGLYGLVSLNVEGRVREFSIRKVLGAGVKHIANSVTRQYFILFMIAIVVGGPLGYFLSTMILHSAYSYHMPFDYSGTIMAVILLTSIVIGTVSSQVRRILKANPVDGLKVE